MRNTAICLSVILGSWVAALGQNPVPQWKVVQAVSLTQNTSVPTTTIFTPTESGVYRLSAYMSIKPDNQTDAGIVGEFAWTDTSHQAAAVPFGLPEGDNSLFFSVVPTMFRPLVGIPVTYFLNSTVSGTGQYNLVFTIEKLE
jgi:hypothetical protein